MRLSLYVLKRRAAKVKKFSVELGNVPMKWILALYLTIKRKFNNQQSMQKPAGV
jgi:hypothetical protein